MQTTKGDRTGEIHFIFDGARQIPGSNMSRMLMNYGPKSIKTSPPLPQFEVHK